MGTISHEYAHMPKHTFVYPHTTHTSHTTAVQQTTHHTQARNKCRGTHTYTTHIPLKHHPTHNTHTTLFHTHTHTLQTCHPHAYAPHHTYTQERTAFYSLCVFLSIINSKKTSTLSDSSSIFMTSWHLITYGWLGLSFSSVKAEI